MGSSLKIDNLPDSPPEWWTKLTSDQKYQYFKKAHKISVEQNKLLQENIKDEKNEIVDYEQVKILIEDNRKFLKKYKPFYPKFGFSGGLQGLLNEGFKVDVIANIAFYKFFLQGRLFLRIEGNLKIYEDRGGGGGLSLGYLF